MNVLQIDQLNIFDYSPAYKKHLIAEIKQTYSNRCQADPRLSDGYRKHVLNLDNIEVTLRPKYDFTLLLSLRYVSIQYSYDIIDWEGSTTKKGNTTFFASHMTPCYVRIGQPNFRPNSHKHIQLSASDPLPNELRKLINTPITYTYISSHMSTTVLPVTVLRRLEEQATAYEDSKAHNFHISLDDYSINQAEVTFCPVDMQFDICVEYNGKKYSQTQHDPIFINTYGETSQHYDTYRIGADNLETIYNVKSRKIKRRYLMMALFNAFDVAATIALLILSSKLLGLDALKQLHWWKIVICSAIFAAFSITSFIFAALTRNLRVSERNYCSSKKVPDLLLDEDADLNKQHKKRRILARTWSLFVFLSTIIISIYIVILCQKSKIDNFWYTPELINVYSEKKETGFTQILTIHSCNQDGFIEATCEFFSSERYAKIKYKGKVTKKNPQKTAVDFTFNAEEYKTDSINYPETFSAEFSEDYKTAFIKDEELVLRTGTHILSNTLSTPEILNSYVCMSSQQNAVLTVNECTNEGIITATYNYVAPGCKYSKQILTGKIVYKDVYGNMLVDFFDQNIVYSTFQEELPAIGAVYFDENFSTVHIGFYDYKNSTQYILSSPADLKKMNGSSATFVLINDIDFDGISFEPINNFRGTLFGNGYSLKNISISSTSSNVGIFNSMRSGYIIDLCVTDAHITVTGTNSNVGILCGSTESSIYNVLVSGEVNAPLCNYVGGVAGFSKYSVPGMLTNAANVIGKDYVGGCFGYQTTVKNITLYDCKNSGIIRGNKYVGGIIGHAKQTSNTLKYELQNCSNSGLIEGDNCVGGYIGYAEIYSSVIQNECISTGNVRGSTHVSASIGKPYK